MAFPSWEGHIWPYHIHDSHSATRPSCRLLFYATNERSNLKYPSFHLEMTWYGHQVTSYHWCPPLDESRVNVAAIQRYSMFATYDRINLDSIVFRCTSVFYSYVDTIENLRERRYNRKHDSKRLELWEGHIWPSQTLGKARKWPSQTLR